MMLQAKNKTCKCKCLNKIRTLLQSHPQPGILQKKVKKLSTLETIVISKGIKK